MKRYNINEHIDEYINKYSQGQFKKNYSKFINLSSNEMHSEIIGDLLIDFFKEIDSLKISKYPYFHDTEKIIAEYMGLSPDNLFLSSGSNDAIKLIIFSLTAKNKSIILQSPNYDFYTTASMLVKTNIAPVELLFDLDFFNDRMKKTIINSSPSLVVITNPNGMTGYCLDYSDMEQWAKLCYDNNHILIIDEAYTAFNDFDHLKLREKYPNVLLIRSFSKSLGIAGLRFGVVAGDNNLINYVKKWYPSNQISIITLDFIAYCIKNISAIKKMQDEIIKNREILKTGIKSLFSKWHVCDSKTNFICIDTKSENEQKNIVSYLKNQNIIVKDMSSSEQLKSFFRMTVGNDRILKICLDLFGQYKEYAYNIEENRL